MHTTGKNLLPTEIDGWLRRAEGNIKILERFDAQFPVPVLNEWRYATRHAISAMLNPHSAEEQGKALGHIKRACFDSTDLVLVVLLSKIQSFLCAYDYDSDLFARVCPEWNDAVRLYSEGSKSLFENTPATESEKAEFCRKTAPLVDSMVSVIMKLAEAETRYMPILRRQRMKDRFETISIVAACVTILDFIYRCL